MIIKFQSKERWHVFDEVDSLEYRYLGNEEQIVCRADALDYTGELLKDGEPERNKVELWFMNKNQLEPTQILTYCPVYLLNNDGRTIDKL